MALNIQLENGFRIESTSFGFVLIQERICQDKDCKGNVAKNAGKLMAYRVGEYTSIDSALTGYLNHAVRTSDCQSIADLQVFIKAVKKEILSIGKC